MVRVDLATNLEESSRRVVVKHSDRLYVQSVVNGISLKSGLFPIMVTFFFLTFNIISLDATIMEH